MFGLREDKRSETRFMLPTVDKDGYVLHKSPTSRRKSGYTPEHVLIAERALGKPLPPRAVVHHHDGNEGNNVSGNLVICENQAYHLLLHVRQRAYRATGNPDKRQCRLCKEWDVTSNMSKKPGKYGYHNHTRCMADYERQRRQRLGLPLRDRRKY